MPLTLMLRRLCLSRCRLRSRELLCCSTYPVLLLLLLLLEEEEEEEERRGLDCGLDCMAVACCCAAAS